MQRKMRKNLLIILSFICLLSVIVSVSYAYFSSVISINGYANVKIELLFDSLDSETLAEYQAQFTENGASTLKDGDLVWGHKGNPYVISEERHLHNLSVLQNAGFFYNKFIKNNYSGTTLAGNTNFSDGYDVPYFLISTREGGAIVIDASKRVIKPIGNDEYPFVGVVKGVSGDAVSLPNGVTTTTSSIHGVTVETSKSSIDYGLFGLVSYLGEEPETTGEETEAVTFTGFISSIGNILFSDVKVRVVSTIWDDIKDFFTNHLFYNKIYEITTEEDPEETHHIGIIVGHAEYANLYSMSIYYSSEDIPAIDLNDSANLDGELPNYASATGYIGFMYNLNPVVTEGSITVGSGINSADVSYGFVGGGGLASGVMPGYIRADQMYEAYNYSVTTGTQQSGDLKLIDARDEEGNLLATPVQGDGFTNYFFTDGVFTFAFSKGQNLNDESSLDTIEDIWKDNDEDGVVDMDSIQLSDSWGIGKDATQNYYYQYLEKITDLNSLNDNDDYFIGIENGGSFKFMNLMTKGKSVSTVSSTIKATEDGEGFGFRYGTKQERENDEKYAVKIKKTQSGTYNITSVKSNYSLGVAESWASTKYIYCGQIGVDTSFTESYIFTYNVEYNISIESDTNNVGAWRLSKNQETYILCSGSEYSTNLIGSGSNSTVPIYIYKIAERGADDGLKNESPYIYIPNGSSKIELPANQYVLYPQSQTSGSTSKIKTNYELKALEDLGWGNDSGDKLWETDANGNSVIRKMFNIKKTVNWSLSIGFGQTQVGEDMVLAPVGTGSYQKQVYLPTGSIGFYINKVPKDGAKIRVIVKIPQSDDSLALGMDSDSSNDDHYLGIWEGTVKNNNSFISFATFDVDDSLMKVELPRSHLLIDGNTNSHYVNSNGASTANEYLNVSYNGQQYRTMLQGGHYLMAYEFVVDSEGLYILAATDVRMQIAYCSVDGVASAGRDGTGGSPLGDIDYVYDNGSKVLLVTDGGTNDDGTEDPNNYYYESFALLHFVNVEEDGTKNRVNQEIIHVYRYVGDTGDVKTNLIINITSNDEYVKCDEIRGTTDNITVNYTPRN